MPGVLGWLLLMLFLLVTWVLFRAPSLAAAGHIYAAMASGVGLARADALRTIVLAAAFALVGPTSQDIAARLRPMAWLVPAAALATVLLLFKLGDGPAYEFIYFRF
jgi:alginate O-acetyltransferase complex protein AlgI